MKNGTNIKDSLYNRVPLQILSFLSKQRNGQDIYGKMLAEEINISRGVTSTILKQMEGFGILESKAVVADKEFADIVREKISKYNIEREIKPVISDALELIQMEKNDKVLLQEVNKGIVLWGGKDE